MDFAIPVEVRTKDKPAASFLLWRIFVHKRYGAGLADSRQGASLHYCNKKTRSAGLRAKSFASLKGLVVRLYHKVVRTTNNSSRCKDKQITNTMQVFHLSFKKYFVKSRVRTLFILASLIAVWDFCDSAKKKTEKLQEWENIPNFAPHQPELWLTLSRVNVN